MWPMCVGYTPGLSGEERSEGLATMDRLIRKGKRLRDARKKKLRSGKNSKPKVILIKEGEQKKQAKQSKAFLYLI